MATAGSLFLFISFIRQSQQRRYTTSIAHTEEERTREDYQVSTCWISEARVKHSAYSCCLDSVVACPSLIFISFSP
eukprot:scaffold5438_cov105-Skeletonema_dohrnii-CCMP3373.AAC.8